MYVKTRRECYCWQTRTTNLYFCHARQFKSSHNNNKALGGDSRCNCLKTYSAKGYITLTFHSNVISQCMEIITCLQVWEKGDPFWDVNHKWLFMQEGAINLSRDQQKSNNLTWLVTGMYADMKSIQRNKTM
jgi:hypothetical protein